MSNTLRYLLLAAAIITAIWILRKIRKLKVKMEDAIFWIVFAVFLAVLGIFPQLTYWATEKIGLMSPANLIFLVVIFLLIEKVFTLSLLVSQLEEKVTTLSAELALRTHAAGTDRQDARQQKESMKQKEPDTEEASIRSDTGDPAKSSTCNKGLPDAL